MTFTPSSWCMCPDCKASRIAESLAKPAVRPAGIPDAGYGKSPMTDALAWLPAFNDERRKRQQVEAQRDMIREQRDAALADLASLKAKPPQPPVGSIVTLKSGGPRMTIAEDHDGKPYCVWWAGQFFATGLFEYAGLVTLPN